MNAYLKMSKEQIKEELEKLKGEYNSFKELNLKLDMSRGKPSPNQLGISDELLSEIQASSDIKTTDGIDCRNYGGLEGIKEMRQIFADILEMDISEVMALGNSSLNLMFDTIARAMQFGSAEGQKPWNKYKKIKFLCPAPGYDRHFAICETFGIEMINIKMNSDGPDMDTIEKLVSKDATIKGCFCVPKYSNPQGITYSDEVVKRFANLKPKAKDFRVIWDNAYCVHHLTEEGDKLLNVFDEAKKVGNEDMFMIFTSTSKISFAGSGVACMASSVKNINFAKKIMSIQTIGPDKINQLRHVRYYKDYDGIKNTMKKHAELIKPKFEVVIDFLDKEIAPLGIGNYHKPNGGYFVSFDTEPGCAKRVVQLCKEGGVTLTGAGATFPYGRDPEDKNIRIAPTFPTVEELSKAMEQFCICVKIATLEKI